MVSLLVQTIVELAQFKATVFNVSDFTFFNNELFGGCSFNETQTEKREREKLNECCKCSILRVLYF